MERDLTKYPAPIRRILQTEDAILGFLVTWFLALTIFPLAAFYFGTIASSNHYGDLRITDMHVGGVYALGGLLIGICFALWATFVYPVYKEREDALESAHHKAVHSDLTHHEEIATDNGQEPEHEQHRPDLADLHEHER